MLFVCTHRKQHQQRQQYKARCSSPLHPYPTYRATAAEVDKQIEFSYCSGLGKHFFCLCCLHPLFAVAVHGVFFYPSLHTPTACSLCVDLSAALLPLSTVALPSEGVQCERTVKRTSLKRQPHCPHFPFFLFFHTSCLFSHRQHLFTLLLLTLHSPLLLNLQQIQLQYG